MKNDNLLWGVKRIQGELLKLDISLSTKTMRKILQAFRRREKVQSSQIRKKFLEMPIRCIYAMDFYTVDTMLGKRSFRTVRREALDNFLLTGKNQVQRILDEYVAFHDSRRPHQGIQQQIPKPGEPEKAGGAVRMSPVLGGLHHHYYRQAA
jgi:hypothetical protein